MHTALALNALGRTGPNPPPTAATAAEADSPAAAAEGAGEPAAALPTSRALRPASDDPWPPETAAAAAPPSSLLSSHDEPPPSSTEPDYAVTAAAAGGGGAWDIRTVPALLQGAGGDPWAVTVARSRAYPGAVAVAQGRRYAWAYVGNGLPWLPAGGAGGAGAPYQPPLPPARMPREYDYLRDAASGDSEAPLGGGGGCFRVAEQCEVTADPGAGKPPSGEGGEEEEEGAA